MSKANKTQETSEDVFQFIEFVENEQKRIDSLKIIELMSDLTRAKPKMWGPSIIGFGNYHYKYASGREGDFFRIGFSPRKQNISLYIMSGFSHYEELLKKLGKHKTGKSCLYINRLDDISEAVLVEIMSRSLDYMRLKYPD